MNRIGVVGGGASGSLVAINLLGRLSVSDELLLFEPSEFLGKGIAYGTHDPSHLLNVRAANMSAFLDNPAHFANWLAPKGYASTSRASSIFAQRRQYGEYLQEVLDQSVERSNAKFRHIRESVENFSRTKEGIEIVSSSGNSCQLDYLVLALGNLPPRTPEGFCSLRGHPRYIASPSGDSALEGIGERDDVFILGTGLTMVDVVLSLIAHGHEGKIVACSRRGQTPRTHQPATPLLWMPSGFKEVIGKARAEGEGWRDIIDGLRPNTQRFWKGLDWEERKRFLRHLQPFWDAHRHRMPEESAAKLGKLAGEGRLTIGRGRVGSADFDGERFVLEFSDGGPRYADWVINCTGPETNRRKAKVPLLEDLVREGEAEYDPLGLGLLVDEQLRTSPAGNIYAIGAMCRGCLWETTAIPEIREQAVIIGNCIIGKANL